MKLVRYAIEGEVAYGVLEEGGVIRRLAGSPFESLAVGSASHPIEQVRLLAPVDAPRIIGVGLNYVSHIKESNQIAPTLPMLFMKHPSSVIGSWGAHRVSAARDRKWTTRENWRSSSVGAPVEYRKTERWSASLGIPARTTSASASSSSPR